MQNVPSYRTTAFRGILSGPGLLQQICTWCPCSAVPVRKEERPMRKEVLPVRKEVLPVRAAVAICCNTPRNSYLVLRKARASAQHTRQQSPVRDSHA